jgi:nicotinamide-nucleotide amidase
MSSIEALASQAAQLLIARRETIATAESSTGGLIAAALLAVPGASAYFLGGGVVYTGAARDALLGLTKTDMTGLRPSSKPYAALCAQRIRDRLGADWGLAETGAAGPSGNRYGDPAGHTCIAIAGPASDAFTLRTGSDARAPNMQAFAAHALARLVETIRQAGTA